MLKEILHTVGVECGYNLNIFKTTVEMKIQRFHNLMEFENSLYLYCNIYKLLHTYTRAVQGVCEITYCTTHST